MRTTCVRNIFGMEAIYERQGGFFCSIKNTILDSDSNGSGTELSEILETIEKQQFLDPAALLQHFGDMFVIDALLGNFDRHNGNWGFLYDPGSYIIASHIDTILHK